MFNFKLPKVSHTLPFNALLHITILFTILAFFFKLYISKIASKAINKEINKIIKAKLNPSLLDGVEQRISVVKQQIDTLKELPEFTNRIADFTNNNPAFTKKSTQTSLSNLSTLPDQIKQNFSYEYYAKLFASQDNRRKKLNEQLFFYINLFNGFLVVILVLFGFYLYRNNAMTPNDFALVGLENVLTFICVGAIEYLFFTNVAIKFIPAPPSLLFKSILDAFKTNLN